MEEIREAPRCINIVPALGGGFCCSEGNYCTCGGVFKKSGDTALQAMTNQYHTALRRADMWRRRAEAAENKLQHITTPESSPVEEENCNAFTDFTKDEESSPAPLESQEELWETVGRRFQNIITTPGFYDVVSEYKSKFILTRRTEGDLER